MADVKISALPNATTPLAGTEILPIVQGGVTEQVSVANLTAGRSVAAASLTVSTSSATEAVRITQTGAGNALVVEDSTNPDATPFVVDATGRIGIGTTSPATSLNISGSSPTLRIEDTGAKRTALDISVSNTEVRFQQTAYVDASNTNMTFYTSNLERMRISSSGVTTITGTGIINASGTTDALRITQTGSGDAIVIEDSTNPDATPFVIDANGRVVIGSGTATGSFGYVPWLQVIGSSYDTNSVLMQGTSSSTSFPILTVSNSSSASYGAISNGQTFGEIRFFGGDGTSPVWGAVISAQVDGTPGTNDMPGRLVFSTTADGAAFPTERMRIDSTGKVSITGSTLRLQTPKTPASATDTGVAGDICWDANYVYVCVATNTWKRSALSTW